MGWPPKETAYDDGWLLRAADGHTKRANSVQALVFAADSDVERAIGRVERWYAARGLPACFQLTDHAAPAGVDAVLDAPWLPGLAVGVRAAGRRGLGGAATTGRGSSCKLRPTPQVMNAICDPYWEAATRRARAELFARIRRPHVFAVCSRAPAGGGRPVRRRWRSRRHLCLRTAVPARGRGLGSAVLRRLIAWARDNGARQIYLQVEDDNAPAHALHRQLAGERAYSYWYRYGRGSAA